MFCFVGGGGAGGGGGWLVGWCGWLVGVVGWLVGWLRNSDDESSSSLKTKGKEKEEYDDGNHDFSNLVSKRKAETERPVRDSDS